MSNETQRYDGASARMILEHLEESIRRQTESRTRAERYELSSCLKEFAPLARDHEHRWDLEAARARGYLIAALGRIQDES